MGDVGAHRSEVVLQLQRDTDMLSRVNVTGYRLLLWVHSSKHPLGDIKDLQAQLRRRCWDRTAHQWCRFQGGFLSMNDDGNFRVAYINLWDILSSPKPDDSR